MLTRFTSSYLYDGKEIKVYYWLDPDAAIHTVLYLGTVQVHLLAKWVAEFCTPGTVVVEGAEHWHAKPDGSDIPDFMFQYGFEAFKTIRAAYGFSRVHLIAESQAVPGAIKLCLDQRHRKFVTRMTLLQPLGLNTKAFGSDDTVRIKTFRRRIAANIRYQLKALIADSRLRHNHRQLIKTIDLKSPMAQAQYASGIAYDATPDLVQLLQSYDAVRIICGGQDRIFRADEIISNLYTHNLAVTISVIPGVPHSPLATQLGLKLVRAALENPA